MKVEIIIERNILEDILQILKNIGTLKNTIVGAVDFKTSGAFPHINKIALLTNCDEKEKQQIIRKIFPIIHKYGGACIASNY